MKYTVNIENYNNFRADVIGKGFNVDGLYGCQCVDGFKLLCQQFGWTMPSSPNGGASGYWDAAYRKKVSEHGFELISNVKKIIRGDIVIFGDTLCKYGHCGFCDKTPGDFSKSAKINILGQNQGGTDGKVPGAEFSLKDYEIKHISGAFRFKKWNDETPVKDDPPIKEEDPSDNVPKEGGIIIKYADYTVNSSDPKSRYNIRSLPTTKAEIIGKLPVNTEYKKFMSTSVESDGNTFNLIEYGGILGWCAV